MLTMSRTYRNNPEYSYFRRPKTRRERSQNLAIEADTKVEPEYPISKENRRHRFIPTDYDDLNYST